jgi:transposase
MKEHNTVGLDLGDRFSSLCVLDGGGEVVEEGRVTTTEAVFRRKFGAMERSVVALEVCGHSPWVSRLLEELGHEVVVAQAAKVALIHQNRKKGDRVDAQTLALLAYTSPKLLWPIRHRGPKTQADLQVIRSREALVQARTKLINHVRSTVKVHGHRLPSCSAEAFARKMNTQVPEGLRGALLPVLEVVSDLTRRIKDYDREIARLCSQYEETQGLQQVPGVGPVTSLAFVLTLEDPRRFGKSRDVGAYLGLTPRRDQSGQVDKQLRITKAGNTYLRKLLVGSAQYLLGPFASDCALRQWGLARTSRGGKNGKKRAVVAVARKLAVLLHRLWMTGERYEPFPGREPAPVAGAESRILKKKSA